MRIFLTLVLVIVCFSIKAQSAWTNYSVSNSPLQENSVRAIRFENDTTVWIGNEAGLARLQGSTWTTYNTSNSGLPWDDVRSILIDKKNVKWFGTFNGGLASYNDTSWTVISTLNSPIADDNVRTFVFDNNNTKWIGGGGGGITKIDSLNNFSVYQMFTSALASNNIAASYIDTITNDKYFGTVNGGLTIVQNDTGFTTYTIQTSGIPDNTILGIVRDNVQNTWFASPANGLVVKLPGFGWFKYTPFNSNIASYALTSIDINDSTQDLWMGSIDMGLIKKSGTTYSDFNTSNSDLTDNVVQCVRIAPDGKIWIGTATKGVFVLDPSLLTGLNENKIHTNVNVFPNPVTKGYTIIQGGKEFESSVLFDLSGKEIISQQIKAFESTLDLRNIKSGIYFLRLKMADGSFVSKKIVVSN